MSNWLVTFIFISLLFINLLQNIVVLLLCKNSAYRTDVLDDFKHRRWYTRAPMQVWYWLVCLYIYGIIPYLTRILICSIISIGLLSLSLIIPTHTIEQFFVVFAIMCIPAMLVIAYGISYVYLLVEKSTKQKKKK